MPFGVVFVKFLPLKAVLLVESAMREPGKWEVHRPKEIFLSTLALLLLEKKDRS